ncbi:carbamoyltransferase HypF [Deferribacter autotrophicus]|uniref:Carbamoyltransferase n=1 Tax=Deferribacter autotrophicus TaxID=500465 RepID=A0A5A8F212_9BACT|nr:carbamoyltransferase HypF [Deferribacter autotrophicus]KAA0257992.1 carbamoyltransferase HypF [Deferribacter autotrophicus]
MKTYYINIQGIVQGVGFRPFIYRLANELGISGCVKNSTKGVEIEANVDNEELLKLFINKIRKEAPLLSHIVEINYEEIEEKHFHGFKILHSEKRNDITFVSPDAAICDDCKRELFDTNDRRFLYPFINCTNCGPRYSIIEKIPYDRVNTTMKVFEMCDDCRKEYNQPDNRRFHAQPNCCLLCGPDVYMDNLKGITAVKEAAKRIDEGALLAVKGLGGYHLICDATNDDAVLYLRKCKKRNEKPFAVMVKDVDTLKKYKLNCEGVYSRFLNSPEAPIILINWKDHPLSKYINPMNDKIGIMLAYTPLHQLIMHFTKTDFIVATSGNQKDEPIVIDERDAEKTLFFVNGGFLHHNRPIHNRVDDSVAALVENEIYVLRRGRGFAPYPIMLKNNFKEDVLGVGAHLKNSVSLGKKNYIFPSQYIGDLDNVKCCEFFKEVVHKLQNLFDANVKVVIRDLHPDYYSSIYAEELGLKVLKLQHHIAHFFSCMAENGIEDNCIGVSFDGLGLGCDKKVWGSEFFVFKDDKIERVFHLKYARQVGDASSKKPFLMILSYLNQYRLLEDMQDLLIKKWDMTINELDFFVKVIERGINTIETSSMGRFFEGIGSLITGRVENEFEGHTAMLLESLAEKRPPEKRSYPFYFNEDGEIDFGGIVSGICRDLLIGVEKEVIAAKFHNSVAEIIREGCEKIREFSGVNKVTLTGGVFQNLLLLSKVKDLLRKNGFEIYIHRKVPPNDGGISLGQVYYYNLKTNLNLPDTFEKFW